MARVEPVDPVTADPSEKLSNAPLSPLREPAVLRRKLELTRFSYMAIGAIDCVAQQFRAQIFFELRFPGGAKDTDLRMEGYEFPKPRHDGGLPRPPAGWFMKQIDLKNFIYHNEPLNQTVMSRGDDIYIAMRFEGEFFENMELEMFPFDMQELSVDIAINCRTMGKIPVDFSVAKDAQIGISRSGFSQHQIYDLDARMTYIERLTGDDPPCYPTITISARVYRKPEFVLINVALPMAVFVIMGALQFAVPVENQEVRLGVTLTLILTAASYKSTISDLTPDIAYLTFADKYILMMNLMIFLLVVEGALAGMDAIKRGETHFNSDADLYCLWACITLFVLIHVWGLLKIVMTDRTKIDPGKTACRVAGPLKHKSNSRLLLNKESRTKTEPHGLVSTQSGQYTVDANTRAPLR